MLLPLARKQIAQRAFTGNIRPAADSDADDDYLYESSVFS
jgi:hypothetical protein